ncbi:MULTISPECIES: mandelate racemase/muconate lactonizing enzyme family protein [Pseudomonas]|uniref:mandelate racemase/muconate lactonizing enzyme family protein n=1 Tax=Pseudomonas TaxID=286 RepID=UPI0003B2FB48|nr:MULTISPECIES: mandelate racemase/muconate lactonizing enzyme family protein [Pseudomonas]ERO60121.1 hypothetical protein P308_15635 [Pseudomonas piscis]POA52556.1 mandelate racemase [Pseudomonas sp. FW507-12TSA]
MKISAIEVHGFAVPLREPYSLNGGQLRYSELDSTVVLVRTDGGLVGVGESCPWGATYLPGFGKGVRAGLAELAPQLIGCNPLHLDVLNHSMDLLLPGHPYVKAALDIACWDILGKFAGLPVHALLGGRFQDAIGLQSSIPIATPQEMQVQLERARHEGYRTHSCKVGSGVEEDIARIDCLLQQRQVGEVITFDVNRAWTVAEAAAVMNSLADPTVCFEQPCQTTRQCQHLRTLTRNPIILDESIVTLDDLVFAQQNHVCQVIGLKIGRVGGLTKARRMRDFCVEQGIRMNIEDTGGTQVSDSAMLHLATATPRRLHRASWNCCRHHDLQLARGGFSIHEGRARVDDRPGLGLQLNDELFTTPVAVYG